MYTDFIENASTDKEKDNFLEELMKIYDNRIKYFDQEGYVLGRKGTDWLKYKLDPLRSNPIEGEELKDTYKKGYEWLSKSVSEQGNETEAAVLVLLMQTSRQLFRLEEITKETVISNYNKCISISNAVIEENANEARVSRMKEIQPSIEELFGRSGRC